MTAISQSVKASSRPLCISDLSRLIERLAVEPNSDHDGGHREKRDRPELGEDFRQAISFELQAAHDPHRVRRGDEFTDPLGPDRHALERKHEPRKQNRRQNGKQCKLDRLQLVCFHRRKRDPKRQIAGYEQAHSDKEQRHRSPNRLLEEQDGDGENERHLDINITIMVLEMKVPRGSDFTGRASSAPAVVIGSPLWNLAYKAEGTPCSFCTYPILC
jgi:hypothetical protein